MILATVAANRGRRRGRHGGDGDAGTECALRRRGTHRQQPADLRRAESILRQIADGSPGTGLRRLAEEIGLTGLTDGPPDRRLGLALNRIARKAT
ncbi:hypothetical protein C3492_18650 [Streptomyces sp. Ru62]|uniref:hypothetical protein n=1 Tax=Streptomyces sp. Ru62 TaxID=2080745 RepID=UPI000CDD9AEA|nr:hypothetical protein [Streptomyces sp. Ru62]POX62262.1 hypothetical protein C3492_18650 [Streptomyces sp. Ru62]